MKGSILTAAVSALLLGGAARAADGPDFDQGRAGAAAAKPASVWVTFDRKDLARAEAKGLPLSVPVLSDARTAVYKVAPEMLPVLSSFMHETFNRCGGFFSSRTPEQAKASMRAASATAGGPYTVDQQAVVTPLVARVKETELRGTIQSLAAFNNRYYSADTGVQAAHWIQGEWGKIAARIPGATVELVSHEGWSQPSVVMTIPGSDKADEIVVLGGHEDSINGWGDPDARAPGADDNASGIAVLTETARILADGGFRPRRTLQFMAYAAEEVGLRGSQDIAERWTASGKKVVAVIQYDMTNYKGDEPDIYLLNDYTDAALNGFLARLIDAYVGVKWSTTECGYACSDHASWNRQGVPAAIAFESSFDGMNHNIHTDHDSLANSGGDARHSVVFAKLAVAFAVEAAKTAGAPSVARRHADKTQG